MGTDEENKNKSFDETRELLNKFYKPDKEIDKELFWQEVSKKIDSLFHKELFLEKCIDKEGKLLSDEECYWLGLEQYISNEVSSLKHKVITDHLLKCSECRKNYIDLLDKKKKLIR